jgi:hypothetical protein
MIDVDSQGKIHGIWDMTHKDLTNQNLWYKTYKTQKICEFHKQNMGRSEEIW